MKKIKSAPDYVLDLLQREDWQRPDIPLGRYQLTVESQERREAPFLPFHPGKSIQYLVFDIPCHAFFSSLPPVLSRYHLPW